MAWTRDELVAALDGTDLWSDVAEEVRESARRQILDGEYPFNLDLLDEWMVFADGEDLAEGGVEDLLVELEPILARVDLDLEVRRLVDPYGEAEADHYVVEINGRPCLIWHQEDFKYEGVWGQATVRPLARVNELLADAGAKKRVFTLYAGGNEGLAYVLDPEVVDVVRASGLVISRDMPTLAQVD